MYVYRVDLAKNFRNIQKDGFRCGSAGRFSQAVADDLARQNPQLDPSLPVETAWAKKEGLAIPKNSEMFKPRLYYWSSEQYLDPGAGNPLPAASHWLATAIKENKYLGFRFPAEFIDPANSYPDGSFSKDAACYCLFPDKNIGDVVVPPSQISVRHGKSWYSLRFFSLLSLILR